MPKKKLVPASEIAGRPDWAIVTDHQAAQLMGVSVDTLNRLADPPPKVQLSARRQGRRICDIKAWINARIMVA